MANESKQLREFKDAQIAELTARHDRKLITKGSYQFLTKLIEKADTEEEVLHIVELGLVHRKTGLTYVPQVEYDTGMIYYLKRDPERSFICDKDAVTHKLIVGDNYPALKNLLITHRSAIDVIYIDPPYGVDSMGQFAKTNYDNAINRDHLLSQLYPRLQLAKQLLSERGVIFCSIDDKNQAYVKCLFDEVFGEVNFIASMIVTSSPSKNNTNTVGVVHEYMLIYALNKSRLDDMAWKVKKNNIDEFQKRARQLVNRGLTSEEIHKELLELVKYPRFYDFDHYTYADAKGVYRQVSTGGVTNGNTTSVVLHPVTGKPCKMPDGGWRFNEESLRQRIKDGLFDFGADETFVPRTKLYIDEYPMQTPRSVCFFDSQSDAKWLNTKCKLPFPFPKAIQLIKYVISMYPSNDITVLDFYAGSATTAHAVMDLNADDGGTRQCILVTLDEETQGGLSDIVTDVTYPRLYLIMKGTYPDGKSAPAKLSQREPYGDNLETYTIDIVNPVETNKDECAFSVIDETCYGREPFDDFQDKVEWVCRNFERTQKSGLKAGDE